MKEMKKKNYCKNQIQNSVGKKKKSAIFKMNFITLFRFLLSKNTLT